MSRRERVLKQSILIACEGHTEQRYFGGIRDEVNTDPRYSVHVQLLELEDGTPQDPKGLVREAHKIRQDEGYDEIWVVFDKDRDRDIDVQAAYEYAHTHNIHIAFSSISFEHWILLHFEKNNTAFERSDCASRGSICTCNGRSCICTYLKKDLFPNYKKASFKLYLDLKEKNNNAVENSAWLKFKNRKHLNDSREIQYPYTLNPHTDVDCLVVKLLALEKIIFSEPNISALINGLDIMITSVQESTLITRITNNQHVTFIVNNYCDFKVKGEDEVLYSHATDPVEIAPGETKIINLVFNDIPVTPLEFRFKDTNTVLVVGLT